MLCKNKKKIEKLKDVKDWQKEGKLSMLSLSAEQLS